MAKRYIPLGTDQIKTVVDNILEKSTVLVGDEECMGVSQSYLIASLRDKGYRVSGNDYWFTDQLEKLGYSVGKAKVGKWTKGGWKLCQPARCVYV